MELGRNFLTLPVPLPCVTGETEEEEAGRVDGNADPPVRPRCAAVQEMTRLVRVLAASYSAKGFCSAPGSSAGFGRERSGRSQRLGGWWCWRSGRTERTGDAAISVGRKHSTSSLLQKEKEKGQKWRPRWSSWGPWGLHRRSLSARGRVRAGPSTV